MSTEKPNPEIERAAKRRKHLMFRMRYILGILVGSLGVLYLYFAIFAFSQVDSFGRDAIFCYLLALTHGIACTYLIGSSLKDMRVELSDVRERFNELMIIQGGFISTADLATRAMISLEDADSFLRKESKRRLCVIKELDHGIRLYIFLPNDGDGSVRSVLAEPVLTG